MQTLTNVPILVGLQDTFDFYYGNETEIVVAVTAKTLSKTAPPFINQNKKFIENQLGLNELIYKLHQANENSTAPYLKKNLTEQKLSKMSVLILFYD